MTALHASADPFAPVTGKAPSTANGHDAAWRPIVPIPTDAPRTIPGHPLGKPSGQWFYRDETATLMMMVRRFDAQDGKKEFRPYTYCEDGHGRREWRAQGLDSPRPLYGLERLAARPGPVLVVEGEKTADAARNIFPDRVCITSAGGSAGARHADWSPLAGRHVTLWPDNDDPGKRYVVEAAEQIAAAGALSVRVVKVPSDWPRGWDLADELPAGVSTGVYVEMIEAAGSVGGVQDAIDLSPLRDGRSEPPTLPIDLFGAWSDWIERAAEAANAPADYVAASLLAGAAGVIGNSRWAEAWHGWSEPPTLWIGAVGDPSSGKSPSADFMLAAMRQIEKEELTKFEPERLRHEARREMAEAATAQWKDAVKVAAKQGAKPPLKPDHANTPDDLSPPRIILQDVTPEASAAVLAANPRGIFNTRDELSGWLGGMDRYNAGGERSYWIEAYGGRQYRVDRKGGKSFTIPRLTISIFGGLQPAKFTSLVGDTDDDGLAARFLWVWPQARPFARPKRTHDPARVLDAFRRLRALPMIEDEHGPRPVYVRCTEEAADILAEWRTEHQATVSYGGSLMNSWRGKGGGHVLRLALVLEFLEWAYVGEGDQPAAISGAAVMRAAALYSDYLLPMAQRVFGDAGLPESERDAGAVAQYIRATRPEFIHVRNDIYRKRVGGISDASRAQRAIDGLVEAGWLFDAASRDGPNAGRRKNLYSVNPALWDAIKGARANG